MCDADGRLGESVDGEVVVRRRRQGGGRDDVGASGRRGRVLRARVLRRRLLVDGRRRPGDRDADGRVRTHGGRPVRAPRVRFDRLPRRRAGRRRPAVLRAPTLSIPRVDVAQRPTVSHRARLLSRGQLRLRHGFVLYTG